MSKKNGETQINKPLEKECGLYDAAAIFIGAYIVMLLLQFLFSVVLQITDVPMGEEAENAFDKSSAYSCIVVALNELAFFAAPFLYSKIKGRRVWTNCGLGGKTKPVYLVLAVFIGLFMLPAFSPIATLINSGFSALGFESTVVPSAQNAGVLAAYAAVTALLPAVVEEFLFRGHVSRGFAGRGYVFGMLLSSLLFALTHGSPVQLVYQFFIGMITCWTYYVTRSLWTSVIEHFVSNIAVLLLDFVLTSSGIDYIEITGTAAGIMAGATVGGIAALLGLCYLLYRLAIKARGVEEELKTVKGASPKAWDMRLRLLFESEEERQKREEEEAFRLSQIANAATPEIKEMLIQRFESEDKKDDKKEIKGLIVCFALPGVIFVLNTILGFVQ